METHRGYAIVAAAALLVTTFASAAVAQTTDHLKCYKVKDVAATFKSAAADIVPSRPQFPGDKCTIKGKAAQLCVPVDKDNVSVEEPVGTLPDFTSQELQDAQLCYKVKCLAADSFTFQVSDQFGTRTITRGKSTKVCGPAVEQ
jgi:hypothetical protein